MITIKNIGNYKIDLNEKSNTFLVSEKINDSEDYEELKTFSFLNDAETYIYNREERKSRGVVKKVAPLNVLKSTYNENYEELKITSLSREKYGLYVWASDGKRRSKTSADYLLENNDENKRKIKEIAELRDKMGELKDSLNYITKDALLKHFPEAEE